MSISGVSRLSLDLDRITPRVRAYERRSCPVGDLCAAAVLVPIREGDDGPELILTLRPRHLASHGGQVAFPGGRVDPGDDTRWDTALRESREELGLEPQDLIRVGLLDDLPTVTHFHVTPCVALVLPSAHLVPARGEVEEVFAVPLVHFLEPSRRRTMQISGRPTAHGDGAAPRHPWTARSEVVFFLTAPHVVWGATAAIIDNLLEVLVPGDP